MNKAYFLVVALLIIVTIGVGSFAIYRSVRPAETKNSTQPPLTSPKSLNSKEPEATKPVPPTISDEPITNNLVLTVSSPTPNLETNKSTITVKGTTVAGADVTVNDKELTANKTGSFQTTVMLVEGDNQIYVFASDELGNFAEWQGTVVYNPDL